MLKKTLMIGMVATQLAASGCAWWNRENRPQVEVAVKCAAKCSRACASACVHRALDKPGARACPAPDKK